MKFSIVFDQSGDTIPFVAQNPAVVEYYIEHTTRLDCNQFSIFDNKFATTLRNQIDNLNSRLLSANQWINSLFDCCFQTFAHEEYLDQQNLGYLHDHWVKLQSRKYDIDSKRTEHNYQGIAEHIHNQYPDAERFPKFSDVAGKIGHAENFLQINRLIHRIEYSFEKILCGANTDWVEIPNPFEKSIINFDICNLWLPFSHLGRCQSDRFIYDHDLLYDDENTFNELLKFVALGLSIPQNVAYSNQYVDWCAKHNRIPSGNRIPLGNIPDLPTNLTRYRIIVYRNATAGNAFKINLHKG